MTSGDLEVRDAMDQMFLPDYPLITLISCGLTFDQIWQVTEVVEKRAWISNAQSSEPVVKTLTTGLKP